MKLFLILISVVIAVLADHHIPTKEEYLQARQNCFDELHMSEDLKQHIVNFEYPNEEVVHKYVRCCAKRLGTWDDTTGFKLDYITDIATEKITDEHEKHEIRNKIEKCLDKNEQQSNLDLWAYRQHICFVRTGISPIKDKLSH